MQYDGIYIGSVGPDDRSEFLIHLHLAKQVGVFQESCEHGAAQKLLHIDVASGPVVEGQTELESIKSFY